MWIGLNDRGAQKGEGKFSWAKEGYAYYILLEV